MTAKDGVVGSSRKEDDVLPAAELKRLPGQLGTGVFGCDIQTPSISTPLSIARTPKGASFLSLICASTMFGDESRSLPSTVEYVRSLHLECKFFAKPRMMARTWIISNHIH
jgi:hypothetical protein